MTTATRINAPAEPDAVIAIKKLIDDYLSGIKDVLADLGKDLSVWAGQVSAYLTDFNDQIDTQGAIVTGAILEWLAEYEGPLTPILFNSTTKFVQFLDDAANRKLGSDDADTRIKEVADAFHTDLLEMSQLSQSDFEDELYLIRDAVNDLSDYLAPTLGEAGAALADAIAGYIEDFVIGFDAGTDSNDNMLGGTGDNKMLGLGGDDTMDGGWGDDQMFGGQGSDHMMGGFGHDMMHGGDDDDVMYGGAGNDKMSGDDGADDVQGGYGDDVVDGGIGNDRLDGGANNDVITGGDGADLIIGGYGQDTLSGGEGQDTFVFNDFSGKDVITDFESGVDTIEIAGWTWSFNNLNVSQVGANTEITYAFAQIVLEDTDASTITAADFDFV